MLHFSRISLLLRYIGFWRYEWKRGRKREKMNSNRNCKTISSPINPDHKSSFAVVGVVVVVKLWYHYLIIFFKLYVKICIYPFACLECNNVPLRTYSHCVMWSFFLQQFSFLFGVQMRKFKLTFSFLTGKTRTRWVRNWVVYVWCQPFRVIFGLKLFFPFELLQFPDHSNDSIYVYWGGKRIFYDFLHVQICFPLQLLSEYKLNLTGNHRVVHHIEPKKETQNNNDFFSTIFKSSYILKFKIHSKL